MTAHDAMNDVQFTGALYHGTRYPLKPGDLISPDEASKFANYAETEPTHVFASTNAIKASGFGGKADEQQAELRSIANGNPPLPRNRMHPPRVFQVEPTGPIEPDDDWEGEQGSIKTRHPLRVIRQHDPWSSS